MLKVNKDALICDLAETYHIYDYKALPARQLAVLSCGLRPNSRIKQAMSGHEYYDMQTLMTASAVDKLNHIIWMFAEGSTPDNHPKSIVKKLLNIDDPEKDPTVRKFYTKEEFEEARREILEGR